MILGTIPYFPLSPFEKIGFCKKNRLNSLIFLTFVVEKVGLQSPTIIFLNMKKGETKLERLYKSLSQAQKKGLDKWVKDRFNEGTLRYTLYIQLKAYCEQNVENKIKTWKSWIEKKQIKVTKLNDESHELCKEIDTFLLTQRLDNQWNIQREIELFYIYRDLKLEEDNKYRMPAIKQEMEAHTNLYNQFIFSQLELENAITHKLPSTDALLIKMNERFYLFVLTEYLFLACSNIDAHTKFRGFPLEFIQSFIKDSLYLANNTLVQFYLNFYLFLTTESLTKKQIQSVLSSIKTCFVQLTISRQRDIHSLFNNKLVDWYGKKEKGNQTYENAAIFFEYRFAYLHEEKLRGLKMLQFEDYQNLLSLCFTVFDDSPNKLKEILKNIENAIFPNVLLKGTPKERLWNMRKRWKLGENLSEILDIRSSEFSDKNHKMIFTLLQCKVGFDLYRLDDYKNEKMLDKVFEKLRKRPKTESDTTEFAIWESIRKIFTSQDIASEIKMLETTHKEYQNSQIVITDRSWYIDSLVYCIKKGKERVF